jgi:hypothetical protein
MKTILGELTTTARALVELKMEVSGVARKVLNYVATSVRLSFFTSSSHRPVRRLHALSSEASLLTSRPSSKIKHTHGLASFAVFQPLAPVVASLRLLHARWSALEQKQASFSQLVRASGELSNVLEEAMEPDGWSAFFSSVLPRRNRD